MDTLDQRLENLVEEYQSLVDDARVQKDSQDDVDWQAIQRALVSEADWSDHGASALVLLARSYGTFMLANALALAHTLEIEDGSMGF